MQESFQIFIEQWGNIGIFIFSYFEGFILPFPVDPFVIGTAIAQNNIFYPIAFTTLGLTFGASTGYFLGKLLGENFFIKFFGKRKFKRGEKVFEKWGPWGVFIAALTPIPFEIVVWLSGIFRMKFLIFLGLAIIGRLLRLIILMSFAYYGLSFF